MTEERRPMRIFPRSPTEYEKGYQDGVFDMIARQECREQIRRMERRPVKPEIPPPPAPRTRWQRWIDRLHAWLT